MPRLIQVIESEITRGLGRDESPRRVVIQYHTPEGEFLAEKDTWEPTLYDHDIAKIRMERAKENHGLLRPDKQEVSQ